MRVLIVGDASGSFLYNLVKNLKQKDGSCLFDVLNINENRNSVYVAENSGYFETVYNIYKDFGYINKIPKFRGIVRELFKIAQIKKVLKNNYEAIIIFGLWPVSCKFYSRNSAAFPFALSVIMGSDYLQLDKRVDKKTFFKTLQLSDLVLIGNPILYKKIISENLVPEKKLRNVLYGSELLEYLNNNERISRDKAKELMGISPNTVVIVCGYNANPNQQHLAIIEQLKKVKLPNDHLLIFPLTYGGNKEYKLEIKQLLNTTDFKIQFLETYVENSEVAILRRATDIFIQVQKTDSFSGSMQENLYCGNIVITGSWLPYDELRNRGIKYFTINSIEGLGDELPYFLDNIIEIQKEIETINSPEKFYPGMWTNCIKNWQDALMECKTLN